MTDRLIYETASDGHEFVVGITEGRLDFGAGEWIFYAEFNGRRRKLALVKIIRE
jgi:thiamine phosphate synthase YjbQ (UPF0047 family)